MRRVLPGTVCVTALTLSACTMLGPDYSEPKVEWRERWQPDLYGQVAATQSRSQADLSFWWRLFNDPVLDDLIEKARRENPTLRIAGLRILESRAALGIAGSNRYPQAQQVSGAASRVDNELKGGQAAVRKQTYT